MVVFKTVALQNFQKRMVVHLTNHFPEEIAKMEEPVLPDLIEESMNTAATYGITDENDVVRFLEYCVEYGSNFGKTQKSKWAGRILENHSISGYEKMNEIDDYDLFVLKT